MRSSVEFFCGVGTSSVRTNGRVMSGTGGWRSLIFFVCNAQAVGAALRGLFRGVRNRAVWETPERDKTRNRALLNSKGAPPVLGRYSSMGGPTMPDPNGSTTVDSSSSDKPTSLG